MAKEIKTAYVPVKMTPGLKKALEIAAERDHRDISSLIRKIVIEYLQKKRIKYK